MTIWEERRDAKTCVLASDGTMQMVIFHLTASRRGDFGRLARRAS
jgi:hypothetical protein